MDAERLAYMANQIGKYFASQRGNPAKGIADHLVKFWDPRMRSEIIAFAKSGHAKLDPKVAEAIEMLARSNMKPS